MKKIFWFAIRSIKLITTFMVIMIGSSLFISPQAAAQSSPDSLIRLGMNWFTMRPSNQYFDSTFGCNLYHTSSNDDSADAFLSKINSGSKLVYCSFGAIFRYSEGQSFQYQAIPRQNIDTLRQYAFLSRDTSTGHVPTLAPTYWQIDSNTSGSYPLDTILWNNEFASSWRNYDPQDVKLAVRLNVFTPPGASDSMKNVVTILLRQVEHLYKPTRDTTIWDTTFNVLWRDCGTNDKVYISDLYHTPYFVDWGAEDGYDTVTDGYQITVISKRYVTTRLAYVAIFNAYADTLLSGVMLDNNSSLVPPNARYSYSGNSSYTGDSLKFNIADSLILHDSLTGYQLDGSKYGPAIYAYYLADEPAVAGYASQGRVNSDSLLNRRGASEHGTAVQTPRYIAQVKPKTIWSGIYAPEAQVSAWADVNIPLDSCMSVSYDSTHMRWDTSYGCSKISTMKKYRVNQSGYLDFNETKEEHALFTKVNHLKCNPSGFFDDYDARSGLSALISK
ncbi:MAG TPA: hypothetical protein VFJ29_04435 [Candidatus Kapabacteria bacterium]|nr:hypothetical protein [Candidatus Kapabacteria bacterium]